MNNPIDPEELLRDAVVDAALEFYSREFSDDHSGYVGARSALHASSAMLSDHRAKASAPVAPSGDDFQPVLDAIVERELMSKNRPAHPDIRVEPTLSEVRKIWHDHFGARCSHPNADADIMGFALEVLSHFSPTVSPEPKAPGISGAKMAEMAFEMVCGVPAAKLHSPTQTSITDEEIIEELNRACNSARNMGDGIAYVIFGKDAITMVRTLLSQHSNHISAETPTIESARELVEKMPRGTIWKTQLDELVEYTKAAVVRFGVGR